MILKDPKILFVHIPKTGGQSMTKYLQENVGKKYNLRDTECGLYEDNQSLKKPGPDNSHHLFYKEYIEYNWVMDNVNTYFSFAVVRNPYDRFVSAFHWWHELKTHTYKSFIENFPTEFRAGLDRHFSRQSDFVMYQGKIGVDKIFRLEYDIPVNFTKFMEEKFGFTKPIGVVNKAHAKKKTPLDRATIDWINDHYDQDFKLFGYEKA
jgi:hypothetical protein